MPEKSGVSEAVWKLIHSGKMKHPVREIQEEEPEPEDEELSKPVEKNTRLYREKHSRSWIQQK